MDPPAVKQILTTVCDKHQKGWGTRKGVPTTAGRVPDDLVTDVVTKTKFLIMKANYACWEIFD